jgi:signal peptidase
MTGIPATAEPVTAPAAPEGDALRRPRRRRRFDRLRPAAITTVGVIGLIAVTLTLLPLVGLQVVRLATGSMSPLFPPDSLLLAQSVPASEAHVGDIVMVQRSGELPVTHRVVAVSPRGDAAELRLKGDANPTEDPVPYDVTRVDKVLGGIPWGGQIVTAARSPFALGGLTVLATLLVLWAWWPRSRTADDRP